MGFKSRKFYVWLISLGAVFVVYLLYSQLSETPEIKIDRGAETVADSNLGDFGSEIGMVGDVGVGTVKVAKFITLNKNKSVDRELGFEKLLHETGNEWEVEKPYMNVFRRNLKCHLTADRGHIQIEDTVGRPSPKDATLTGNVVIHILPEKGSDIKESFIYLDDLVFISEESQFSTDGPVKFVSQNALMLGKGMELVYNDELDHLDFLRIIHLDSLRLKTSSEAGLFSSGKTTETDIDNLGEAGSQTQTEPPAEPVAAKVSQETKKIHAESKPATEERGSEYYRTVFSENVIIDSPEQLIVADELSISNILWSNAPSEKPVKADIAEADTKRPSNVPVTSQSQPDEPLEEFVDTIVTCNNGIIVTPMDSPRTPKNSAKLKTPAVDDKRLKSFDETTGRTTFVAQKIDYSEPTGDITASGTSELTFYVADIMGAEANETTVPVKVNARKKATFLPALNQVIFEGNVLCTMLQEKPNFQQKYTLSAPKLTVYFSKDNQSEANIEHLTATGETVQLDTSKWAGEEVLGFTKLKCPKFDYDAGQQMYLATGPGIIALDNSKIAEPERKVSRFSLQKPCSAVVRGFDTLKYFSKANQIIADAKREQMFIDYFPIVQGQYGQQVSATTSHIEAMLYETTGGRTELSTLSATGGVTYKEEGKKNRWGKRKDIQFVGSEMFYDGSKSIITAWGDELQPCLFNGVLAPGIEYNLKTGRIKTKVIGPGMLQMQR
ncbi:MAG: LPS export ABC transporter periplasmic protein LptC [Planctomycetota bacterium]|jgi:hypothetical protein